MVQQIKNTKAYHIILLALDCSNTFTLSNLVLLKKKNGHPFSTHFDVTSCFYDDQSAAWRSGSERRFYDDHDRTVDRFTSQPSLVVASLDKMLHDDYLCLVESGKQQIKEVRRKFKRKTWKQRQLLSESGFVLRIAPPSLSRDRRIKMKKSIIIIIKFCFYFNDFIKKI